MEVLQSFILPKWRFRLVLGKVTIATTCWLYQEVQRVVRQTLQAPSNLSKKWIHLEMKKGGLGIPDALEMTYLGKARLAGRLSNSKDGNVRLVYDTRLWGSELSGFERHLRRQRALISHHDAHRCLNSDGSDGATLFRAVVLKPLSCITAHIVV